MHQHAGGANPINPLAVDFQVIDASRARKRLHAQDGHRTRAALEEFRCRKLAILGKEKIVASIRKVFRGLLPGKRKATPLTTRPVSKNLLRNHLMAAWVSPSLDTHQKRQPLTSRGICSKQLIPLRRTNA